MGVEATKFLLTLRIEQVRKGGLPPLVHSKQQRGQAAPLPDLFYS